MFCSVRSLTGWDRARLVLEHKGSFGPCCSSACCAIHAGVGKAGVLFSLLPACVTIRPTTSVFCLHHRHCSLALTTTAQTHVRPLCLLLLEIVCTFLLRHASPSPPPPLSRLPASPCRFQPASRSLAMTATQTCLAGAPAVPGYGCCVHRWMPLDSRERLDNCPQTCPTSCRETSILGFVLVCSATSTCTPCMAMQRQKLCTQTS